MSSDEPSFTRAPAVDPQVAALRVPPHSIEAEQSVLGGLLLDNQAFDRVADLLREEDFYRYDHRFPSKQRIADEVLRWGIENREVYLPHQAIVEFVG